MPNHELTYNDFNILYTSVALPVSYGTDERDFILATVLDQTGEVIETTEISVEELKVGDLFNFNPGRILRTLGYIAGSYKVRLNFLRRKAGSNVYGFLIILENCGKEQFNELMVNIILEQIHKQRMFNCCRDKNWHTMY